MFGIKLGLSNTILGAMLNNGGVGETREIPFNYYGENPLN